VNVYKVNQSLQTGDTFGDNPLTSFLRAKIIEPSKQEQLSVQAEEALSSIFMSCFSETEGLVEDESYVEDEFGAILLTGIQLSAKVLQCYKHI
jgi:acetylornithine/succinyldiaminopimelate/putrescine aminotransferase